MKMPDSSLRICSSARDTRFLADLELFIFSKSAISSYSILYIYRKHTASRCRNVNCSNNNLIFWLSSKRSSSSIKESNIVTSFTVKSIRSYTASLLISDLSISISLFFNDLKRKYFKFCTFFNEEGLDNIL